MWVAQAGGQTALYTSTMLPLLRIVLMTLSRVAVSAKSTEHSPPRPLALDITPGKDFWNKIMRLTPGKCTRKHKDLAAGVATCALLEADRVCADLCSHQGL